MAPKLFEKQFAAHNLFQKNTSNFNTTPHVDPRLLKKAFNLSQVNKTPKHKQITSNFTTTTPYSQKEDPTESMKDIVLTWQGRVPFSS
jgi:hypothetical protein